jgi:prepilin-type N-terminal cleavage/methylation domain-containing protein
MRGRGGFTIIELIVVLIVFTVVVAIALPRAMRTTPRQQVHTAARQLTRDLEQARMQAIAAKRVVRVKFDVTQRFYAAFQDVSAARNGTIQETEPEARAAGFVVRDKVGGIPGARLPSGVEFGFGAAAQGPLGYASGDPVVLPNDRVEFDARGMVRPVGGVRTGGLIVLVHQDDPEAVSAVTISGAGAFRTWDYRDGAWR